MTAWRAEDDALLVRLEDESVLDAVFRRHVGPARTDVALPARASGLITSARSVVDGSAAVAQALAGDPGPLAELLASSSLKGAPPRYLHHLALYWAAVADARSDHAADSAAVAWARSATAWLALAEEATYLTSLTAAVLGAGAPSEGSDEAVARPLTLLIADLAARADAAARSLEPTGQAALSALRSVTERIASSALSSTTRARLGRDADRARARAVDAALARVAEALDDVDARGRTAEESALLLARVDGIWRWSGHDPSVPPFLLERLAPVAWDIYRTRDKDKLRALMDPHRAMIEAYASRVEVDPELLAYAAACAQMFVFFSDVATTVPSKLTMAERAVKVCPTHRNGRVILAALLCDTALAAIQKLGLVTSRQEIERIQSILDRAARVHPETSGLADAQAELDTARRTKIVR